MSPPRRIVAGLTSPLVANAVLVLAWGSTFTSIKVSLQGVPPMLLAGGRCLAGGIIIASVAMIAHRAPRLRDNLVPYAVLTLLNVVGFFGLQTLAIEYLPSGYASVLIYLQPVFTVLLAAPLLGEPLGPARLAGVLTAFIGVVVVSLQPSGDVSTWGVVLGIVAAGCWALGTIAAKRFSPRLELLWAVALPLVAGGAALTLFAGVTGDLAVDPSGRVAFAVAWTTLVGTAIAWLIWMRLVSGGQAGTVAVSIFLVPPLAVVLGWAVLGETLGWSLAVGTALVCAGVLIVNRQTAPSHQADP